MAQNTPVMKMTRRYGRTVYEVAAYCSPDSKATYDVLSDHRRPRFSPIYSLFFTGSNQQLQSIYGDCFYTVIRSITSNNSSEFASFPQLLPDIPVFYAHPYSSYERSMYDKQNSLIFHFLRKSCSLDGIGGDVVQRVQDWLNRLPR